MKKFFFQKKSHSAEKCRRGDPLGFIIHSVAKNEKTRRGDPFETLKIFSKKSRTVPKQIQRGHVRFCRFILKKGKLKRGTLWTKSPLAGFGLRCSGSFRIVSKKWTDQCDDCSLKKKTVTAIVRHFSLNGKAPTKKRPTTSLAFLFCKSGELTDFKETLLKLVFKLDSL